MKSAGAGALWEAASSWLEASGWSRSLPSVFSPCPQAQHRIAGDAERCIGRRVAPTKRGTAPPCAPPAPHTPRSLHICLPSRFLFSQVQALLGCV